MTSPAELHKLLDACRPEHADWNEPEMAALADALAQDALAQDALAQSDALGDIQLASQTFDRAFQAQIADVPVPDGLADRILDQLGLTPASPPPSAAQPLAPPAVETARRRSGRLWFAAASAAVCLTLAISGMWWWSQTVRSPASAEELASVSSEWGTTLQASSTWNPSLESAPRSYAPSRQVRASALGWQPFSTPYDRRAASYALEGPLSDGWLIVLRTTAPFLPADDRPRKMPTTGAWAVHAWVEGDHLFVLVTRDRPRHAEQFLAPRELAGISNPIHAFPAG